MKVLFDTSTLIAGMLPDHVHHAAAYSWHSKSMSGSLKLTISAHSLAEVYSVLTRLPRTPRISPDDAWKMIQANITSHAQIATLSGTQYADLIAECARQGIGGGKIYDAVIAKVAELMQVDHLVTLNVAHFLQVWPAGAAHILSATTSPP